MSAACGRSVPLDTPDAVQARVGKLNVTVDRLQRRAIGFHAQTDSQAKGRISS